MPTVAFRTIRSRQKFARALEVKKELEQTLDRVVKPHFIEAFKRVVVNWKNKPEFKARKFIQADLIKVNVFPAGEHKNIWIYVSGGTKPHIITAKRAPLLVFEAGRYVPKTAPVGKFGGPGVVRDGQVVRKRSVNHPGSEPREFEKVIRDDNKDWYSRTMENAWRRAIRKL